MLSGVEYSAAETFTILAFLLVVVPLVIGYLIASFGLVYGLVLGISPAILAVFELPTNLLGLSAHTGVVVLFFASVVLAGLSGFSGQRLAVWRDAG